MIVAGDFNCIIDTSESTGNTNYSRALKSMTQCLGLHDAWDSTRNRTGYTHFTAHSASRIDRIYVTENIMKRKTGIEMVPVAFLDHSAVSLRLATNTPAPTRGRGHWKMNIQLLSDKVFRNKITMEWDTWKRHIKHYPNPVLWWTRFVKHRTKMTFVTEGVERKKDRRLMETFYYATIHSILQEGVTSTTNITKLNALKQKLLG
jgi:hypothetical protein